MQRVHKKLEDSQLFEWDQFAEPLADFRDKGGLTEITEGEAAKLIEGCPNGGIPTLDPLSGDRQTHVEKA